MKRPNKRTNRPKQFNCQVEPNFPDHQTVVFSIRSPDVYLSESESGEMIVKNWND